MRLCKRFNVLEISWRSQISRYSREAKMPSLHPGIGNCWQTGQSWRQGLVPSRQEQNCTGWCKCLLIVSIATLCSSLSVCYPSQGRRFSCVIAMVWVVITYPTNMVKLSTPDSQFRSSLWVLTRFAPANEFQLLAYARLNRIGY